MTDAPSPTPEESGTWPEPQDLAAELAAQVVALQNQLAEAQSASAAAKDAQLRAAAEAENRIRRAEREAGNSIKFAAENVLKDLLPVADSLELGIKAAGAKPDGVARALVEGKVMTLKQLISILEKHGVKQLDPVGQPYNAEHHQVMGMAPGGDEVPNNHVLSVMQKGYLLHERLLRPALVIVAQG